MTFEYTLAILQNEIHPPPREHQTEVDFVIKMLTEGQGYLTKRTETEPYCRVIFFDSDAVK